MLLIQDNNLAVFWVGLEPKSAERGGEMLPLL